MTLWTEQLLARPSAKATFRTNGRFRACKLNSPQAPSHFLSLLKYLPDGTGSGRGGGVLWGSLPSQLGYLGQALQANLHYGVFLGATVAFSRLLP